jgi:hypothetical protein
LTIGKTFDIVGNIKRVNNDSKTKGDSEMFSASTNETLKTLAKECGSTIADVAEKIVLFALASGVDVHTLGCRPALKKGRKAKPVTAEPTAPAAEPVAETSAPAVAV